MSLKYGKKQKGKSVDRSSDWTDWILDAKTKRYYRERYDSKGRQIREDGGPVTASDASKETPRSETGSDMAPNYTSNPTSAQSSYYMNDQYGYQQPQDSSVGIDSLSSALQDTGISSTNQPSVAYSTSYSNPYNSADTQGTSSSDGYGSAQPIPMRSSATRSTPYGGRGYSASAPVGGYMNSRNSSTSGPTDSFTEEPAWYYDGDQGRDPNPYGRYQTTQTAANDQYATRADVGGSSATYASGSNKFEIHMAIRGNNENKGTGKTSRTDKSKGADSTLSPSFKIHHSKRFKPGQASVFKILWAEPRGENYSNATDVTPFTVEDTQLGEKAHSSIRRFVIVATDEGHCQCLPILTYGHQATTKWGVKGGDHAIIYVGKNPPGKVDGEDKLTKPPIRMIPNTPQDKLNSLSRINYAKIYTVEHNVKVQFIGKIEAASSLQMMKDFDDTWSKKRQIVY